MFPKQPPKISHVVHIRNQRIFFDLQLIYQNEDKGMDFLAAAFRHLHIEYPRFFKMDEMCRNGFIAAAYLLQHSDLQHVSAYKKGIVLQNKSASLQTDKKYFTTINNNASPALFVYTLPNIVIGEIAIRHLFKGENTFFITEKFDAKQLYDYNKPLFDNEIVSHLITGFIEVTESQTDVFLCFLERDGQYHFDEKTLNSLYAQSLIQ